MKDNRLPIYLYFPNMVGYFRLIFLFMGIFLIQSYPILGSVFFISNLLLDAVDGQLARMLNQCSKFGAVLDYATDRISFASYIILLASIYPSYLALLCIWVNLDLLSHFFRLTETYALNKASHKDTTQNDPWILRLYYNRFALGSICLSHDLFLIFLYLYHLYPSFGLRFFLCFLASGALVKVIVHVVQIIHAAKSLLTMKKSIDP